MLPGAIVGGNRVVLLQVLGALVIERWISGASDTYGTFAVVIALLSWIYLCSAHLAAERRAQRRARTRAVSAFDGAARGAHRRRPDGGRARHPAGPHAQAPADGAEPDEGKANDVTA